MSARLSVNLRERHGFTYGAYSRLDARTGSGSMVISAAVRSDATDSALVEAIGEWRRIVRDTVPTPEFQGALNALVVGFPSLVQTVQGLRDASRRRSVRGCRPISTPATVNDSRRSVPLRPTPRRCGCCDSSRRSSSWLATCAP
jgi:hypothetical protein